MKKLFLLMTFCLLVISASQAQQWGLYTLYCTFNGTQAYLIDTNGTNFKTWTFSSSSKNGFSCYLLPGDTLLRSVTMTNQLQAAAMTGKVQKVLWDGTVVWEYTHSSSTYCLHHDIAPMPNGNVLMISYETKTGAEALAAGCNSSTVIWPEKIIEVAPTGPATGNIVWEWHLWDHLCQNSNASKPNYVTSIINNPQLMNINYLPAKDWWHMNGIDYNPVLDQIVVTSRMMNEFFIIDHSTTTAEAASHSGGKGGRGGDFLFRWGNPAAYGATGTKNFNVVHYPQWIPENYPKCPNQISAINNGGGTGGKTCVDVVLPPYNGYNYSYTAGQVIPPATYSYRHTSTKTTPVNGSAQLLPNGNMLVNISQQNYLYEIDSTGTVLWSKTISGQAANAMRYDKCYVRGPQVKAIATPSAVTSGSLVQLSAVANSPTETNPAYTYLWSTGDTIQNPAMHPVASTTYHVTVTDPAVGCSASAYVRVDIVAGIEEPPIEGLNIYPNPTAGIISLEGEMLAGKHFLVKIFNEEGQLVMESRDAIKLNLSGHAGGIYFLKLFMDGKETESRKIVLKR
jgi:hypothetical protein